MTNSTILNGVTRAFHKVGFQVKKYSPEILIGVGIVGAVTSTILACKATTKVNDILEKTKNSVDIIHDGIENGEIDGVECTPEDGKKALAIVYTKTGLEFAKLYAPAVAVGALSITSILAAHNILNKRVVASAAAYAIVDRNFKDYRGRVVERFGEALDRELRYNIKSQEVDEIVVDDEGNETIVKKTVQTAFINEESDYARFFDETCAGWDKNPEFNLTFLKNQQRFANEKLKAQGYLFLNDVYESLGIRKTQAGQCVGWIYDDKNPVGDNYVDFGIYDIHDEQKRLFVNGYERSILLDFNVDGNILYHFEK